MKERGTISIKNSISGALYDSIKSTIDEMKARKGEPFNIVDIMTLKCTSILRLTLFGDFGATDEQIRKFNELYLRELVVLIPSNLFLSGAIAKYFILPLKSDYRDLQKNHEQMENVLREMIDYHKSTYDEDNIRDIIDEYFKERDIRRKKGDPTAKYFTGRKCRLPTLTNRSQEQCVEEDVETWVACEAEDCGFQMLNDDEIEIFVQEESDPIDDETDEDEGNNNNESSKGPSNADVFSALETAWSGTNNNQSAVLLNNCCSRESETLQRKNEGVQWCSEKYVIIFHNKGPFVLVRHVRIPTLPGTFGERGEVEETGNKKAKTELYKC
ncbi:cytochrome P450 2J3 [Trichonephila clavipes]|nr:cytochrome P450 2J3 [Trichonephila clavipes]